MGCVKKLITLKPVDYLQDINMKQYREFEIDLTIIMKKSEKLQERILYTFPPPYFTSRGLIRERPFETEDSLLHCQRSLIHVFQTFIFRKEVCLLTRCTALICWKILESVWCLDQDSDSNQELIISGKKKSRINTQKHILICPIHQTEIIIKLSCFFSSINDEMQI